VKVKLLLKFKISKCCVCIARLRVANFVSIGATSLLDRIRLDVTELLLLAVRCWDSMFISACCLCGRRFMTVLTLVVSRCQKNLEISDSSLVKSQ